MFKPLLRLFGLLPMGLAMMAGSCLAADTLTGVWLDQSGEGAIEIADCNGKLCGRVVWLKSDKNSETCNKQIIGNVAPTGAARWGGGWIFDPESNTTFDVEITPLGRQKLKVLGYAGSKLFGRTMTWTRAPADLKRCDGSTPGVQTAQVVPPQAPAVAATAAQPAAVQPADRLPPTAAVPSAALGRPKLQAETPSTRRGKRLAAAVSTPLQRAERHAASAKRRVPQPTLIRLSDLGLDNVTFRKSRGGCSITISDVGRVSFPC